MALTLKMSCSITVPLTVFVLSLLFSFSTSAEVSPPIPICNSTPYPSLCRSSLPTNNATANVYDYGRFSVKKSLSAAHKFLSLIEKYLSRPSGLTAGTIGALQDCRLLAESNIDFLANSFQVVNKTQTLSTLRADDVQTLLSALLTNTQTCLDGLEETASSWRSKNGVSIPLANDTRLYRVSLALFRKGWVHNKKRGSSKPHKRHSAFKDGKLPLKMSEKNRAIFETVGRRKLLQTETNQVVVRDIVIVSQDGTGNYTTINDAIAASPNNSIAGNGYHLIYVTAGVYEEYVSIAKNKKYLMMIGDGINQTVITGNNNVVDGSTTFNSATFAVVGQGFVAVNLTIRNTAGAIKHQAVALRSGADLSTFYSCSFEGYQDTLYVHSLRQFYTECDIYGTVDFIFGNAAVVFQNCNIYPRLPMSGQFNAITAQGRTDPNQNTGISIQNCNIRAADDLASNNGTTKTYLGRPWKEYSRTVYMQSYIDTLVNSVGWREWSGDFALSTLYYAEYSNNGPGSNTTSRVTWPGYHMINATDAGNFTVSSFLLGDDWLPQTGAPYSSSL
ncbi:putative pectinesterase/pectinesterase inhibitor 7 [Apium graveolens]|uniref:putative pectinesterase/pectinesterase inhibitor 7 n=1 Tax=Apium graveolens TaxID=4045 RepID=UPI003D7B3D6E